MHAQLTDLKAKTVAQPTAERRASYTRTTWDRRPKYNKIKHAARRHAPSTFITVFTCSCRLRATAAPQLLHCHHRTFNLCGHFGGDRAGPGAPVTPVQKDPPASTHNGAFVQCGTVTGRALARVWFGRFAAGLITVSGYADARAFLTVLARRPRGTAEWTFVERRSGRFDDARYPRRLVNGGRFFCFFKGIIC